MKFEIKDLKKGGYRLWNKSVVGLIELGNIVLYKENNKIYSRCYQNEDLFDYFGIEKALCGKTYEHPKHERFTPKKILVIQMK